MASKKKTGAVRSVASRKHSVKRDGRTKSSASFGAALAERLSTMRGQAKKLIAKKSVRGVKVKKRAMPVRVVPQERLKLVPPSQRKGKRFGLAKQIAEKKKTEKQAKYDAKRLVAKWRRGDTLAVTGKKRIEVDSKELPAGSFVVSGPFWSDANKAYRITFYQVDPDLPGRRFESSFYCSNVRDADQLGQAVQTVKTRQEWFDLRDLAIKLAEAREDGFMYRLMNGDREVFITEDTMKRAAVIASQRYKEKEVVQ